MGVDHSFKLIISNKNRALVDQYLQENTLDPVDFNHEISGAIALLVEPDRFLRRYFRDAYCCSFGYKDTSIEAFMIGKRCYVGMFYYEIKQFNPNEFSITFTCATSDMSLMCNDSLSIRAWFINLCKAGNASLGVYHCENRHYEIFWWNQAVCALQLSESIFADPDSSLEILQDFYPLAFDSRYNAIDQ